MEDMLQKLTFEQADILFQRGIVGTIEFRNWLARTYPDFGAVRDDDVDNSIRELAELRQKSIKEDSLI